MLLRQQRNILMIEEQEEKHTCRIGVLDNNISHYFIVNNEPSHYEYFGFISPELFYKYCPDCGKKMILLKKNLNVF